MAQITNKMKHYKNNKYDYKNSLNNLKYIKNV